MKRNTAGRKRKAKLSLGTLVLALVLLVGFVPIQAMGGESESGLVVVNGVGYSTGDIYIGSEGAQPVEEETQEGLETPQAAAAGTLAENTGGEAVQGSDFGIETEQETENTGNEASSIVGEAAVSSGILEEERAATTSVAVETASAMETSALSSSITEETASEAKTSSLSSGATEEAGKGNSSSAAVGSSSSPASGSVAGGDISMQEDTEEELEDDENEPSEEELALFALPTGLGLLDGLEDLEIDEYKTAHDEASLIAAVAAANAGEITEITLTDSFTVSGVITIPNSTHVVLVSDSSGPHSIIATTADRHFSFGNEWASTYATLTLGDITLDGNDVGGGIFMEGANSALNLEPGSVITKIANNTAVNILYTAIFNMNGGEISYNNSISVSLQYGATFNMRGGKISNNIDGTAVVASTTSTSGTRTRVTIEDGEISNNNGGGVHLIDVDFNMTGGSIFGNTGDNGAGIHSAGRYGVENFEDEAEFNLSNCAIYNNTASSNGGGIHVSNLLVNIENVDIYGNTARLGGAVFHPRSDDIYAELNIVNCNIYGNNAHTAGGGGLSIYSSLNMKNCSIHDNDSVGNGGGIVANGEKATLNIQDTEFYNNRAGNGGAISVAYSNLYMSNVSITNNTAAVSGGGVYLYGEFAVSSETVIVGGVISNNKAEGTTGVGDGGGIYGSNANLRIDGTEIESNTAKRYGGGICSYRGEIEFENGLISENTSEKSGGGIYLNASEFQMLSGIVKENNGDIGGGIYSYDSPYSGNNINITINNGKISDNTANMGGGIYLDSNSSVNLTGGSIQNNTATADGGGIYSNYTTGKIEITGGEIANNSASGDGGGIYLYGRNLEMSAGRIAENSAVNGGGIYLYHSASGTVYIDGGEIDGNTATANGGGIYTSNYALVTMRGGGFSGNTAGNGARSFNLSGTPSEATHNEQIQNLSSLSSPFTWNPSAVNQTMNKAYNNFDINYTGGALLSLYTVTFDTDGGSPVPSMQLRAAGDLVDVPTPEPTKADHRFLGWFYDDGTDEIEWNFDTMTVQGDMELVAHWQSPFTVTFDTDGGTPIPAAQQKYLDEKVDEPNPEPTKADHRFLGWFYDDGINEIEWNFDTMTVQGNMELVAHWQSPFTVTFDADGGTPVPTLQQKYLNEKVDEPTDPTKADHRFLGWFYDDGTDEIEWNFATMTVQGDMELMAHWQSPFTVTFNTDGGAPIPSTQQKYLDEKVDEPDPEPTKADHRFIGWFYDNGINKTEWNFDTMTVQGNMELVAHWDEYFTVTFYPNVGASWQEQYLAGALLDEPAPSHSVGHVPYGWYTHPTAGNRWNFAGDGMPSGNLELYERERKATFTVYYHDGIGDEVQTRNALYGSLVEFLQPTIDPSDKEFVEWHERDTGRTWNFEADTMPAENLHLVAVWKDRENSSSSSSEAGSSSIVETSSSVESSSSERPESSSVAGQSSSEGENSSSVAQSSEVSSHTEGGGGEEPSSTAPVTQSSSSSSRPASSSTSAVSALTSSSEVGNGGTGGTSAGGNGGESAGSTGGGEGSASASEAAGTGRGGSGGSGVTMRILGMDVPMGSFGSVEGWSLVSLILSCLALFSSVFLAAKMLAAKRREKAVAQEQEAVDDAEFLAPKSEEEIQAEKKKRLWTWVAVAGGLLPLFFFLITENLARMQLLSKWTPLIALLCVLQIALIAVGYFVGRNKQEKETDEATPA